MMAITSVPRPIRTDPTARIAVVTHANGVDFLMSDAPCRNWFAAV